MLERLVDDAIALRELQQLIELFLRRIGVDVEAQPDLSKADRRLLGNAARATAIESTLRGASAGPPQGPPRRCARAPRSARRGRGWEWWRAGRGAAPDRGVRPFRGGPPGDGPGALR